MTAVPGLLVKGGADGVHVAALPGAAPWRSSSTTAVTGAGRRRSVPALQRLGVPAEVLAPWLLTPVSGGDGVVGEVAPRRRCVG